MRRKGRSTGLKQDGLFQSTHPHGVRHCSLYVISPCFNISIHAPTWGATRALVAQQRQHPISIHAPTWGATCLILSPFILLGISIHAPTWGATNTPADIYVINRISIHAPTWGATLNHCLSNFPHDISIHAPTWGATRYLLMPPKRGRKFQSTHPHGVRRFLWRQKRS